MNLNKYIENWGILFCWAIASIASLGSLFFSEVMEFSPCVFCWYQRIAMYPLVILFTIGLFHSIKTTIHFTFPIALVGWFLALYHNLLHYGVIPESATPCRSGVPCSTIYINWFGFLTIPMLSFIAFSIILICLIILNRSITNEK